MRILLELEALADYPYDNDYHYHMQAFVYSLIRGTGKEHLHDGLGYKFFCFSNIFPYRAFLEKGSEAHLLLSSPDPQMISAIADLVSTGRVHEAKIGSMHFKLGGVKGPFRLAIDQPLRVRSATPIIIRIPTARYEEYEIQSERPYLYWRETISLEAFVKQLRDNMEKKIVQYRSRENELGYISKERESVPLPDVLSYRFVKMVSKPITVKGSKQQVIGSIWELEFAPQSDLEAFNLEFALDSGFGERNSLGFGFMNEV